MPERLDELLDQALQSRKEHRLDDARRSLLEATEIARQSQAKLDLARALTRLGQIERDLRHSDAALQCYEEAVAIYRDEGDALRLAHGVRHMADIHLEQKRRDVAERCYYEALAIYRAQEEVSPLELANAIRGLAVLKSGDRETGEAKLLWQEARDLYDAAGVHAGVEESSHRLDILRKRQ